MFEIKLRLVSLKENNGNQCDLWKPEDGWRKAVGDLLINSFLIQVQMKIPKYEIQVLYHIQGQSSKFLTVQHFWINISFDLNSNAVYQRDTVEALGSRAGFVSLAPGLFDGVSPPAVSGALCPSAEALEPSLLPTFEKFTKTTSDISPSITPAGAVPSPEK